jgi:hypothetical protein
MKGLKLLPQVTGLLGLIELPFPEGCAKDACTALSSGSCPIEAGETIVYEIDLEVKKTDKSHIFVKDLQFYEELAND